MQSYVSLSKNYRNVFQCCSGIRLRSKSQRENISCCQWNSLILLKFLRFSKFFCHTHVVAWSWTQLKSSEVKVGTFSCLMYVSCMCFLFMLLRFHLNTTMIPNAPTLNRACRNDEVSKGADVSLLRWQRRWKKGFPQVQTCLSRSDSYSRAHTCEEMHTSTHSEVRLLLWGLITAFWLCWWVLILAWQWLNACWHHVGSEPRTDPAVGANENTVWCVWHRKLISYRYLRISQS